MRRRTVLVIVAITLVAGAALLWPRGTRLSAEEQVVEKILELKRGVEAKDLGGVLGCISDDYSDGTYTKREITGLLVEAFRSPEPLSVHAEPPEVSVEGDRAAARIRAEFWVGRDVSPQDRQQLDVTAQFARQGRRWNLVRASGWEAASGALE